MASAPEAKKYSVAFGDFTMRVKNDGGMNNVRLLFVDITFSFSIRASALTERSLGKHSNPMRAALLKLFEETVPESYKAGYPGKHASGVTLVGFLQCPDCKSSSDSVHAARLCWNDTYKVMEYRSQSRGQLSIYADDSGFGK
jgi:hypothetical protein